MSKKTNTAKIIATCTADINFNLTGIPQPLHGTITTGKNRKEINSPKVTINDDNTMTFIGSDDTPNLTGDDVTMINAWMRKNKTRKFINTRMNIDTQS